MWPQPVSKLAQAVVASSWAMRLSALGLRLRSGIHESATLFPAAARERHLLLRWIVSARSAHIALLAALMINVLSCTMARAIAGPVRRALREMAIGPCKARAVRAFNSFA